jgi:FMN phosphatase YigB (HAD superfamily)
VIKNIIFDIGNVLVYYRPIEFLSKKYPEEDVLFLFSAIFDTQEWLDLDKGTKTESEVLRIFIDRNPERELILREVMSDLCSIFTPIESTVEILKLLKIHEYNLLYLSNISHQIYSCIFEKYDFFNNFNGGIISAKVNMMKPDTDIYIRLINKYKIDPGESIFIDDTKNNILTASNLGFETIHLASPVTLQKDLDLLGINT